MSAAGSGTYRAALRHPEFRRLISAYFVSAVGQTFSTVAMAMAIFTRTRSAGWVAAISAARLVPYLVIPGIAGVVASRIPRRPLLMASAGARAALALLIAAAFTTSTPPLVIVVLASLFTALGAPCYPAMAAAVPATLTVEDLAPGNGLLTAVETLSFVAGPALGGLVLLRGSPATALFINAGIFVIAAGLAARLEPAPPPMLAPGSMGEELVAGFRALRAVPELAAPVVLVVVVNLTYGGALVALVVYADRILKGTGDFGLLNAGLGIGALVGVASTNHLARARHQLLVLGTVALLAGVPFALLGGVTTSVVATLLMTLAGAGGVATEVLALTLVQRAVSQARVAHVFGMLDSLLFAALFIGSLLAPALIYGLGVRIALAILGAVIPGGALLISARLARGARRRLDADVEARVALLSGLPWLRDAPAPTVEALAAEAQLETIAPGVRLIEEGAEPDDFFVIVSGTFEVLRRSAAGEELVAVLGRGDGFGEIGLLQGVPRTASVVARDQSSVMRVQGGRFVATVSSVAPAAGAAPAGGLFGRLGTSTGAS